jgi:hypothetical protein
MPTFRITYHTSGGSFRREFDATTVAEAETLALSSLSEDPIRYEHGKEKLLIVIRPSFVAAISVEPEPQETTEDRRAGLLGRGR